MDFSLTAAGVTAENFNQTHFTWRRPFGGKVYLSTAVDNRTGSFRPTTVKLTHFPFVSVLNLSPLRYTVGYLKIPLQNSL